MAETEVHEFVVGDEIEEFFESSSVEEDTDESGQSERPSRLSRALSHKEIVTKELRRIGSLSAHALDPETVGVIWHAQIYENDFQDTKSCTPTGDLKPRRPVPHMREGEFFSSLIKTEDGNWMFPGELNGWPGLAMLKVFSITGKTRKLIGGGDIKRVWHAPAEGQSGQPPEYPKGKYSSVRVTLHAPLWSLTGWSEDSPGFVFWFAAQLDAGPKLSHGVKMLDMLRDSTQLASAGNVSECVRAHVFVHRYAKKVERPKDLLTYHAGVLLEWSHQRFTTVVELAWWNGLGGYNGKSNWYDDRDSGDTALFEAMPAGMKAPWRDDRAEIRVLDVPAKNAQEFESYLNKYTGVEARFLDPKIHCSGNIRLTHRSQPDIFRYLINYVSRDGRYNEKFRNCQTFAADFYGFLTGTKDSEPYHE
eukprot:gene16542-19648_t